MSIEAKAFISYSSKDREAANFVELQLRRYGIDVFIDYEKLRVGESFSDQLHKEIKDRQYFILLISDNSIVSKWVQAEVNLAYHENKRIVPIVVNHVDISSSAFWFLLHTEQINLTGWNNKTNDIHINLRKLLRIFDIDYSISLPQPSNKNNDGALTFSNASEIQEIAFVPYSRTEIVTSKISPDGRLLAVSSKDNLVKIWEINTKELLITLTNHNMHDHATRSLAFSPNNILLASSANDELKLWNLETSQELANPDTEGISLIEALTFSLDGALLIISGSFHRGYSGYSGTFIHGRLDIIDLDKKQRKKRLYGYEGIHSYENTAEFSYDRITIDDHIISPNEPKLIALIESLNGGDKNEIKMWNSTNYRELASLKLSHGNTPRCLTITPDGKIIAVGIHKYQEDNEIKLLDSNNLKELHIITTPKYINHLAFSRDGALLAAGCGYYTSPASYCEDASIVIWNTENWKEIKNLVPSEPKYTSVKTLEFTHDCKFIISTTGYGIQYWGIQNSDIS